MNINPIQAEGKLYIGYGGTINNQRLLGKVIEVSKNAFFSINELEIEIKGRKICVNKKSFLKHLSSINLSESDLPEIDRCGYDRFLMKNYKVFDTSNPGLLEVLPDSVREAAFKRMIQAIQDNNVEVALKEIENGAYLNKQFFVVLGRIKFSQEDLIKELKNYALPKRPFWKKNPEKGKPSPYTYRHTPLTFALEHKAQDVANMIFIRKETSCLGDYTYYLNCGNCWWEPLSGLQAEYEYMEPNVKNNKVVINPHTELPELASMSLEELRAIPIIPI